MGAELTELRSSSVGRFVVDLRVLGDDQLAVHQLEAEAGDASQRSPKRVEGVGDVTAAEATADIVARSQSASQRAVLPVPGDLVVGTCEHQLTPSSANGDGIEILFEDHFVGERLTQGVNISLPGVVHHSNRRSRYRHC